MVLEYLKLMEESMIAKENRLCIYTVKKILEVGKKKYTYGGFGDYLTYMAKKF